MTDPGDVGEQLADVLVRLAPLQLGQARRWAELLALLDLREHVQRVVAQALELDDRGGDLLPQQRVLVAAIRPSARLDDVVELAAEGGVLGERRGAALERQQQHRDVPAAALVAEDARLRDSTSVKNTSPKSLAPLICLSGRISTPARAAIRVRMSTSSIVMPRCFLASVLGADQGEHLVGVRGVGGPDLLAVDDVVVAVELGPALQRREVAAGAGLGEALAPDDLVVQQRLDDVALLLVGADGHHGRGEERQPEPVDGLRRAVRGPSPRRRSPAVPGAAAAAVLRRPLDAGEPGLGLVAPPTCGAARSRLRPAARQKPRSRHSIGRLARASRGTRSGTARPPR